MLGSVLLMLTTSAVVLLLPASVGLLSAGRHAHMAAVGDSRRRARLGYAVALVGLGGLGTTALMHAGLAVASLVAALLAASVLAWWPLSHSWAVRGVVVWGLLVASTVGLVGWLAHSVLDSAGSPAELLLGSCGWLALALAVAGLHGHVKERVARRALRHASTPRETTPHSRRTTWLMAALALSGLTAVLAVGGPGLTEDWRSPLAGGTSTDRPSRTPAAAQPSPATTAPGTRSRRLSGGSRRAKSGEHAAGSRSDAGTPTPTPTPTPTAVAPEYPSPQPKSSKTPGYAKDNPNRPEHAGPPGSDRAHGH
ncbi:MAG TPA: hypothetical protein VF165_20700 [Nocardioidaceae bacterium]